MTKRDLIERIHDDLEGNLTSEERNRLHEYLAGDPEASRYYQDWQKIQKQMEQGRISTPKVDLSPGILHKIASAAARREPSRPILIDPVWKRQYTYYSLIFITGILIGFLVFAFVMPDHGGNSPTKGQTSGTLYDSRNFDQMKIADNLLVELPGLRTTIDVRYSTGIVEARIGISSNGETDCVLSFNPEDLQPLNVTSTESAGVSTFSAAYNVVRITSEGKNQYLVRLLNKNSLPNQITLRLIRNEITVYQNSVTINNK